MTEDEMVGWHHRFDGHEFDPLNFLADKGLNIFTEKLSPLEAPALSGFPLAVAVTSQ